MYPSFLGMPPRGTYITIIESFYQYKAPRSPVGAGAEFHLLPGETPCVGCACPGESF